MIRDVRYHETKALDCEIRAIRLRRAADSISVDMSYGEVCERIRGLTTEFAGEDRPGVYVMSMRLQGWGETAVPGLGATPSEALADSLHGLALMLDRRAEGQRNMARRWLERMGAQS